MLPVPRSLEPMLAKTAPRIPTGEGMIYEPKWDGFRCLIFKDGDDVTFGSRGGKPLERYFPEVVAATDAELPQRCVLDGELVIAADGRLQWELLTQRIHPAASRIALLASETPAVFVAFDLLALGDDSYLETPFAQRRDALQRLLAKPGPTIRLTPATTDHAVAEHWFDLYEGAGLDGIIAKPADIGYEPGKRLMTKIKHERTADVVLAGLRWHKDTAPGTTVGSLLLGLYNDAGQLQHVGVAASFTAKRRAELATGLSPLIIDDPAQHPWSAAVEEAQRRPGSVSRWSAGKNLAWVPLRPERVLEVRFDHMEGDRFRHTTHFVRWRPDRDPASCTYAQLSRPVRYDLKAVLGLSQGV